MGSSQSLSSSNREGQAAIMCQLCDIEPKLKWKCLECELKMCQRCKEKVHHKFASAKDHTIVDLKQIREQQLNLNHELPAHLNFKCRDHTDQTCCSFCITCQNCVCQNCIIKTHKSHLICDIVGEYQRKLETIKSGQKNVEDEIKNLREEEEKLCQIESTGQTKYEKVKQEIQEYNKTVEDRIQIQTDELLNSLDKKWNSTLNSIDENIKKMKQQRLQLEEVDDQCKNLLFPSNAIDTNSFSDALIQIEKSNIETQPIDISYPKVPKFIHGDNEITSLIQGELENVPLDINMHDVEVRHLNTNFNDKVGLIAAGSDGSLWIYETKSKKLQMVIQHGEATNILPILTMEFEIYDFALLPSGDLLLALADKSELLQLRYTGGSLLFKSSDFSAEPLQPISVHVTFDNKVIIGIGGTSGHASLMNGPKAVVVMHMTGLYENIFQYNKYKNPLFLYPSCITSSRKGNIAVLEKPFLQFKGRIVVVNRNGDVRNIYKGYAVSKNRPFHPTSITTSPVDNFIISDSITNTFHLLNSEGELITFYSTEVFGINQPFSLSFNVSGMLYVGCVEDEDSNSNAKICKIRNFTL